jgi:hypothetical protein
VPIYREAAAWTRGSRWACLHSDRELTWREHHAIDGDGDGDLGVDHGEGEGRTTRKTTGHRSEVKQECVKRVMGAGSSEWLAKHARHAWQARTSA